MGHDSIDDPVRGSGCNIPLASLAYAVLVDWESERNICCALGEQFDDVPCDADGSRREGKSNLAKDWRNKRKRFITAKALAKTGESK